MQARKEYALKYVIIGGRKCGTTSLQLFLQTNGFQVERREQLFTKNDGFKLYSQEFSDRQPILILRNPVERAYSDWKYARQEKRTKLTYRNYCRVDNYNASLGELNPIKQSKYSNWFKNWNIEMDIMSLNEMMKLKGFPKINSTPGEISKEDREWTERMLID